MKIAIGADHRGFQHKEFIKKNMPSIEWIDVGSFDDQRSDYPIYAHKVVALMLSGQAENGILLCGTGIGMAVTANRYKKIYAAVIWNEEVARLGKSDDNANILALPADFVSPDRSVAIIQAWLAESFKAGRYSQRINMIDECP